jgi:hypothetical protein
MFQSAADMTIRNVVMRPTLNTFLLLSLYVQRRTKTRPYESMHCAFVFRVSNALTDRLCGLVVRVLDYRSRGLGFDSRAL